MLDTINMQTHLTSIQNIYELQAAVKNIFGNSDTKHRFHKKTKQHQVIWTTSGFYPQGILELKIKHKFYPKMIILEAIFKPILITKKKRDLYALCNMSDYQTAVDGFNFFIDILNSELDTFQLPPAIYWDVSRVDYAYQYLTPFYDCILNVLNKGYALAENLGYKDSAYYVNTYRNINIYDKTSQLHLPAVDGEHLLRYEVQCKKSALLYLAQKYRWDRVSIFHIWDENVAKETVITAVRLLVGKNNFYNLNTAEEIIRLSYQARKAEPIIAFLKRTRHHKAKLNNLLSSKIHGYSKNYIRRSIRPALNKIGIAPILIPDCYHISILENPIVQLRKL